VSAHNRRCPLLTEEETKFLSEVCGPALETERDYGVPASVTVAQAILESAAKGADGRYHWGGSRLYREANNPFGIKFSHTTGEEPYRSPTTEYVNGVPERELGVFAHFKDLAAAFRQHAELFKYWRYRAAWAARFHWAKFAVAIRECGYSTDPKYASKLMEIVLAYHLNDRGTLEHYAGLATVAAASSPPTRDAGDSAAPAPVEGTDV
jgi:flagellum-specific peptidoglycan hydrolase FlgJ